YIPLIGIFVAAVWGIADGIRLPRTALAIVTVGAIAAYAAAARHQLGYWKDSVTLWTRATELNLNVDSFRAHVPLGDVLDDQGRAVDAPQYSPAGARGRPPAAGAPHNRGRALAGQGRSAAAAAPSAEPTRLDPGSAAARADLALALTKQGKTDQAL